MKALNASDVVNIEFDLENGFVWAESEADYSNLFQACLVQRVDGKGFKKEINASDSGYDEGLCADYNESLGYSDLESCHTVFIKSCRKAGITVV